MTNGRHSSKAEIAVYLGLGSNMGDRRANLREAIARIEKLGIEVVRESSIYETQPVGFRDQPWFLNQVIEAKMLAGLESGSVFGDAEAIATIQTGALLSELLNIESEMGRERTIANGPRVIDIDLLLFGEMIIAQPKEDAHSSSTNRADIVVPHPRMHLRRFVLEPLCEIAPELAHPVLKKTCREMLAEVKDPSVVGLY
ncbi:MAG: 2-amino-4-hydroxy-6-hydroxymethyldihydropteridine diphosphokinase [Acidobacteriota bacterium]